MSEPLDLLLRRDGARTTLASPGVGLFTRAANTGDVLVGGGSAGVLLVLGRAHELRVPSGTTRVLGRVVGPTHERVQAPVGYGDVLYELETIDEGAASARANAASATSAESRGLVLRAPQSGRFYHRAAPSEPAFVVDGASVSDGQPVGIVEVMKTFTHVVYRASGELPPRAKVLRVVATDGAEVRAGDVLLELARE